MIRTLSLALLLGLFLVGPAAAQELEAPVERIQIAVERLRGLPFQQDVEYTRQSVAELRQMIVRELDRAYPDETLTALEKRLLKFGFVTRPIDLRAVLLRMFSQQVAGYYDPREKRMALIDTRAGTRPGTRAPLETLSRWLIAGSGLSLDDMLLAHELTHAAQDQQFDLLSLPIEALDPEDGTSAAMALVEGDATHVMFDYMLAPQGLDVTGAPELSGNLHAWIDSPVVRGFSMFQPVPRYLMDNLLFPYVYGFDFVLALRLRGGWEAVNQAYADLPVSTEQILHPEKYLEPRDLPAVIHLPALPESFSGWQEVERNTLGEFNIRLLLDGYLPASDAVAGSAGWDGDRFAVFERIQDGRLLAAWYTVWDSESDAQEFFHNFAAMHDTRYGTDASPAGAMPALPAPGIQDWSHVGGEVLLERRERDVLLIDGATAAEVEALRQHFWNSAVERRD